MIAFLSGEGMTLADLQSWYRQGYPFFRTAHIGNVNLSTIILGKLGFPLTLHEDIPGDFPGYMPAFLKLKGKTYCLFPDSNRNTPLLSGLNLSLVPETIRNHCNYHTSIDLHLNTLKQIVPRVETWATYLTSNIEVVTRCLEALLKTQPAALFTAYITEDGRKYIFRSADTGIFIFERDDEQIKITYDVILDICLRYLDFLQILAQGKQVAPVAGLIMSVPFNLVLSIVIPQTNLTHHTNITFHFCGERMFHYMLQEPNESEYNQKIVAALYASILKAIPDLRQDIRLIFVPTTNIADLAPTPKDIDVSQYDCIENPTLNRAITTLAEDNRNLRLFSFTAL